MTADQQRQAAIDSAEAALRILPSANLAAGVDLPTIQAIASHAIRGKGVTKLALATDRQLLRLTVDFEIELKPEDLPPDSDKRALVAKLTPRVVGQVDLFLGVAAALATSPRRALQIKLLPAVRGVRVDKIIVAGNYDLSAAGDVIALLLNRYADNLGGAIAASPLMNIMLPATLQDEFDPSGPINLNLKEAPDVKLALSGHSIKNPFGLGAAAWVIDNDQVAAVIRLAPLDKLPSQPDPLPGTFEGVKAAFKKSLSNGMDISDPPKGAWVAVSKALLAQSLDSAFLQAQPCLTGSGLIPKENFSAKVPTPDGSSIDCTPDRDCTPTKNCDLQVDTRDCRIPRGCSHSHDTRNCRACLLRAPRICAFGSCTGGQCIQSGNDPVCETAKAAQNAAFDAAFNACNALGPIDDAICEAQKATQNGLFRAAKVQCEAGKEGDRLSCEGQKTAKRIGCETEKGALKALHRTGNIANIDGSVTGTGALKLCFRDVHFTDAMDKLQLTLVASGSAELDTHFKFVPLDIAGHILCPLEWTADKRINTTIPLQSTGVGISLTRKAGSYEGRLDKLSVKLHFEPSPLALVLQNINFHLACPVAAGLINGITLNLGEFLPEFMKDYTYTLKPMTFSFASDLPAQLLLGRTIKPNLSETSRALILSGAL
ncbi:hypothetical protein NKJ86_13785 [Mesorhizobium sp. M0025]|uniref:hypothetical protein n=1 Tax=Mesorhizobium sp. M0025 TaxID=2956846 RepID=UPI00333B9296